MPIQPIDLQTLFAHINQVGKEQAAIKEGLTAQQAAHANELIKEMKHKDESVTKGSKTDEDKQKIQAENENDSSGASSSDTEKEKSDDEKKKMSVFTDPNLGKNIDISG
ncbi:MAG: hypothetical protein PF693_21250 [Spirochaetia bacterium]|jgi:hypothetical protein|nr:hypothetical protein [Spirochaetia bacterium]